MCSEYKYTQQAVLFGESESALPSSDAQVSLLDSSTEMSSTTPS
jgi:hypothetical protein